MLEEGKHKLLFQTSDPSDNLTARPHHCHIFPHQEAEDGGRTNMMVLVDNTTMLGSVQADDLNIRELFAGIADFHQLFL